MLGFMKKKEILPIRTYGDSCLGVKAKPVGEITPDIMRTGQILIDTMFEGDGIGLAATQVAIPLRMVALCLPDPSKRGDAPFPMSPGEMELLPKMPFVLVNPEIVSSGSIIETREEGCLSVPEIYAQVSRPSSLTLRAQLLAGPTFTLDCGGLLARAIQHELDHLDGILFIQRVSNSDFDQIKPALAKLLKKSGRKMQHLKRLAKD